jgi:hypothetical protein
LYFASQKTKYLSVKTQGQGKVQDLIAKSFHQPTATNAAETENRAQGTSCCSNYQF